jgi:F0F1-type ATP synthase epsilon subunit
MPLTITLEKGGMTLLVDDSVSLEEIMKAMSGGEVDRKWKANGRRDRGTIIHFSTVTGKSCIVRADDIVFVREITPDEVEENRKKVQEQIEKEKRFTPAPKLAVPHGFRQ